MNINEALSDKGIDATIRASEIGKEKLGDGFRSSTVKKLLKNGFWADIEGKDGVIHKLRVNGGKVEFK